MSPAYILSFVGAYFALLLLISYWTRGTGDNKAFFLANRQAPWFVVAFGMIGASLSGITFISIPGWVTDTQFSYMQVVLGYLVGYLVIGTILLPLYYRLNLTSIYTYLEQRLGINAYKTGAFFFLVSRIIGASFRLFLVATVLQLSIFDAWNVPFAATVILTIALIWIYTFKSGIKTIIWTDTLQTAFMLLAVILSVRLIGQDLELGLMELAETVKASEYSQVFFWDADSSLNFFKQFSSGAFIAIVMTGLDQDMMQKNLSCKTLRDSQKNMFWFSIILAVVNLLFLCLGALLYIYADKHGIRIPEKTDQLFPLLATQYFTPFAGAVFVLGLIAAAYSSADSALTSLTTSFCVDFLGFEKKDGQQQNRVRTRYGVHIGFSVILIITILIFNKINDDAVIHSLFVVAGYTYGPLLGMFSFGLLTKRAVKDRWVIPVCLISPLTCYLLNQYSEELFNGYAFGYELLILNGLLTFTGLLFISKKSQPVNGNKAVQVDVN